MVEVSLTVGKLDASLALLLTKDHHLIEFPTILLPNGVKAGSIVKIRCDRDLETELEEKKQFQAIQDEIINTFGKNLPKAPQLRVKNVTQTSCVLEWDQLDLGTASLKNLVLFRDGKKLGAIPQAMTNKTTKLSGLPIDKTFKFHLRLDTTAGVYKSEEVEVTTHKMTDLSGITVCLGDITPNDQFTVEDIQAALKNMGAHHPAQETVKVDTTHFITMRENKQNPEYVKANDMNIPIIRPEWLKACERERRIVGVRDFYVKDCLLPDILARNYWKKDAPAKLTEASKDTLEGPPVVQVTSPSPETTSKQDLNEKDEGKDSGVPSSEAVEEAKSSENTSGEVSESSKKSEKEGEVKSDEKPDENATVDVTKNEDEVGRTDELDNAQKASETSMSLREEESTKQAIAEPTEQVVTDLKEKTNTNAVEGTPNAASIETQQAETLAQPTAEELTEVDLNESHPESGVAELTDLPKKIEKEEIQEAKEDDTIAEGVDGDEGDENDDDDENENANGKETTDQPAGESKLKKKNKKKKKDKK